MKMSIELRNIAELDLKAAKVLNEKELYPQSIFYFQQSVEKANKAFALITNQVEEKDLLKETEMKHAFETMKKNQNILFYISHRFNNKDYLEKIVESG